MFASVCFSGSSACVYLQMYISKSVTWQVQELSNTMRVCVFVCVRMYLRSSSGASLRVCECVTQTRQDGRSTSGCGLPVHCLTRGHRPPAEPWGPQADLPLWRVLLEEEVCSLQGEDLSQLFSSTTASLEQCWLMIGLQLTTMIIDYYFNFWLFCRFVFSMNQLVVSK